jgi:imidazolonepropionase-like amidohydrolase
LIRAGLTPFEALRAATVNGAEVVGMTVRKGTLTPGKDADMILVPANPLEDLTVLRTPAGVMIRGRWLDAEGLKLLKETL